MTRARDIAGSFLARIALGYVLVACVFAAAWLWSLYGPLTQAAIRQQQQNLTAVAQSAALVASESTATPDQIARQLVARTDLRLTIVGPDGTVVTDSNFDPAQMENHLDRPEVARALSGEVGIARRLSKTEGHEELYVAVPASLDGTRVALRVSQPVAEIEDIAARSRRIGLLLLVVALLVATAIAVRVTRDAVRPVQQLSDSASRMAAGDLTSSVPPVPSDLEGLASSLTSLRDQMRARLDALEAETRTLASTLDGLPDAVLVVDSGVVELANSSADTLFGVPAGGWRGVPLEHAGLPGSVEAAIRAHLGNGQPASCELEIDPMGRTLRLLVTPLEVAGSTRAIVSASDVTERARLERVRRDFVANASHELKTPVAGIRLLAQSVEAASDDGDTETAMMFAQQIEAETARLQRLVTDLLDLSRLETLPSPDTVADVRRTIDLAIAGHRAAAGRKGLALEADLTGATGEDVFAAADPTDLAIAIDNLLDNAIAYTPSGSVRLGLTASDTHVVITVSDTGPGIPAEHQPRVFERFYRVDASRSRDGGGTGLGLALVRHVVERVGGSVTLASSPAGSTFTITLPRA